MRLILGDGGGGATATVRGAAGGDLFPGAVWRYWCCCSRCRPVYGPERQTAVADRRRQNSTPGRWTIVGQARWREPSQRSFPTFIVIVRSSCVRDALVACNRMRQGLDSLSEPVMVAAVVFNHRPPSRVMLILCTSVPPTGGPDFAPNGPQPLADAES